MQPPGTTITGNVIGQQQSATGNMYNDDDEMKSARERERTLP